MKKQNILITIIALFFLTSVSFSQTEVKKAESPKQKDCCTTTQKSDKGDSKMECSKDKKDCNKNTGKKSDCCSSKSGKTTEPSNKSNKKSDCCEKNEKNNSSECPGMKKENNK